jgi:3-oxoacyl-[acyl-carrier-protein] synthase-1
VTRSCYLHGRGLASALGTNLPAALARLEAGAVAPAAWRIGPEASVPYFSIPETSADWYARARLLVCGVVDQCGTDIDRRAPLFIASSSLDVGALENGAPFVPDCLSFVEQLAAWLDWEGPVQWVSTACTSSFNALLSARRMIAGGAVDEALVLGVELTNRFSSAGFSAMQLLDPESPRPLSADRAGLVLGEAVAALHLRSTPARWVLRGGANLVDGSKPTGASRTTVTKMVEIALADSGLTPADVDLIKLQAAGSPQNDAEEIAGLQAIFSPLPPLVSLKHHIGHTLGAAGAAELALLCACLESGPWPGPAGLAADPALGAQLAESSPARTRLILADILGFGGGHACLLLEDRNGGLP